MNYQLELEIRERLADYVEGTLTFDQFRDWFAPVTWDVENSGEYGAETLTYEIELRFAEFTSGHRTEDDLKRTLIVMLNNARVGAPPMLTGSDSISNGQVVHFQSGSVGTPSSEVPA